VSLKTKIGWFIQSIKSQKIHGLAKRPNSKGRVRNKIQGARVYVRCL